MSVFKNPINQYEFVLASIDKYGKIVAEGVEKPNIKDIVASLENDVNAIKKHKDNYLKNSGNSIYTKELNRGSDSRLDINNKHFSLTDKNCIDIVKVK
ncbi:MAG: hypothetical protein AAFO15_01620 [Pseudomonadota bacterium]